MESRSLPVGLLGTWLSNGCGSKGPVLQGKQGKHSKISFERRILTQIWVSSKVVMKQPAKKHDIEDHDVHDETPGESTQKINEKQATGEIRSKIHLDVTFETNLLVKARIRLIHLCSPSGQSF